MTCDERLEKLLNRDEQTMPDDKTVARIIQVKAESLGISQSELGRRIGLTRYKVWSCFTDRRRFTAAELIRACRILGLTLEDFLG